MDEDRCKESVLDISTQWPRFYRCERTATKDGYCWQHHPDTVKERQEKSRKTSEEKWENSPMMRLRKATEEIERLKTQLKQAEKVVGMVQQERGEWKRRAKELYETKCECGAIPENKEWFTESPTAEKPEPPP